MGEIALKEGAQTPKKKKGMPGFLKFLIIFISVIIGLALLLVAAAFICFYDGKHKDIPVKEQYETSEVFNELMVDSLDDAKANKKIAFALAEDQLNQIIYNAFKDNEEAKEYLKNFYVEVTDDSKFDFVAEVQAINFVKTRLTIGTELEVDDNMMVFKVTNVKVGKINHLQGLVNIITQYISLPDFNDAFASAGLHMNLDIKKLTITYDLDDFYSDILNLMGDNDSDYMSIFKEIVAQDSLRTISSTGKDIFALNVDLAKLAVNETTVGITGYETPNGYFDSIVPGVITDVKTLLNNNTISEDNATTVANYFLGGDALLSASEKTVINTYKENTSFAAYTSARYDYTADPSEGLKAKVEDQITKPIPSASETITISTDDLDNMFSTSPALGKLNLFYRDVNKGTNGAKAYKINFVNIDRISTAFKNNNMFIILSVNFNGQSGNITLKCEKQTGDAGFGVLKLNISDLYLGNIKVGEDTKASFVNLISEAMGNDSFDSLFSISNGVLTLNLKSTLDENGVLEAIGYQTSFAFHANTKDEAGGLIIHADR